MKDVKYSQVLFVICLLFPGIVHSAGEISETGTTGMSFLRIPPSARIASLGGAPTAYYTGTSSAWANPALAVGHTGRTVDFTHTEWIEGINQDYAAFSTGGEKSNLGFAVNLFDSGDIELQGDSPSVNSQGNYSITNVALSVTYARKLHETVSMGVTYKKLFEKVSMENAGGYAVDAGFIFKTPIKNLSVAAASRNYGRMGKLKNDRTKLPQEASIGCLYSGFLPKFENGYYFTGDYIMPKYGDSGVRLGIEVIATDILFLRAGYRSDSDIEDMSYGLGILMNKLTADVSYTPMNEGFGNALRFTLGLSGF